MDQPVGGKGADEYHDNVVDIVSIHQKIHHYFKRQLDHGGDHGDGDHDGNAMNFDFYLVQAIPLLTTYQSMIKDRGKIRFSSAVAQQPRVIVSGHDGTKESTQFSTADPDGVEDTDALIAPFPYVPDHVSKRGIRSDLQGLVNKYLDLVERYFPDLYHHMEMESLHKCTITDCP